MYNLNSYHFGENFRRIRKLKKISIREIAQKINKTDTTVYKYERGELMPDIDTVLQICNALEVTFNDIKTNTIFFEGTIEHNHEIAYIVMKNFYATNIKFEKVQMIINLTYSADGKYVGVITGTEDKANMPMMKRCIVTKELVDENNLEEIQKIKDRLKITPEELKHLTEENFLTLDITNETNYKVI